LRFLLAVGDSGVAGLSGVGDSVRRMVPRGRYVMRRSRILPDTSGGIRRRRVLMIVSGRRRRSRILARSALKWGWSNGIGFVLSKRRLIL
jgi:hypothetical protein